MITCPLQVPPGSWSLVPTKDPAQATPYEDELARLVGLPVVEPPLAGSIPDWDGSCVPHRGFIPLRGAGVWCCVCECVGRGGSSVGAGGAPAPPTSLRTMKNYRREKKRRIKKNRGS